MNRSSRYGLVFDFEQSVGSYLYDKKTKKKFLDFFGQYATLAVGYNHPVFDSDEFKEEIIRVGKQKISNCEIGADETRIFDQEFKNYASRAHFKYRHYSCTGALAVEAAIKTAIDYRVPNGQPKVISFQGSFHGIYGIAGMLTGRAGSVKARLDGFPRFSFDPVMAPSTKYSSESEEAKARTSRSLESVEKVLEQDSGEICGILVEPIQCTAGDRYFSREFFSGLRQLADLYDVPLIFDEIQTGFCGTGEIWYHEKFQIAPDILIFGKKTQVAGILVQERFGKIFDTAIRLEATWDGDVVDMLRSRFIIRAYKENNVQDNVTDRSKELVAGLKSISNLRNIRHAGLLVAFDLVDSRKRDHVIHELFRRQMLCSPTQEKTIRLRPHLLVTKEDIKNAIDLLSEVCS